MSGDAERAATPEERAADLWTRPGAPGRAKIAAEIRAAAAQARAEAFGEAAEDMDYCAEMSSMDAQARKAYRKAASRIRAKRDEQRQGDRPGEHDDGQEG